MNGEHADCGHGLGSETCLCRVPAVHWACAPAQTSCSAHLLSAVLSPFKLVLPLHPILYLVACREGFTHDVTAAAQSVPIASPAFCSATSSQNNVLMARKSSACPEKHSAWEKQRTDVDSLCKKTVQPSRGVRSCNELVGRKFMSSVFYPSVDQIQCFILGNDVRAARVVSMRIPNIHDDWQLLLQAAGCKNWDQK